MTTLTETDEVCPACGRYTCSIDIHENIRIACNRPSPKPPSDRPRDEHPVQTTLLHDSAKTGSIEVAVAALVQGEFIDAQAYSLGRYERVDVGWSPVMFAIWHGHTHMARWLLDHGATELRSRAGEWPIELAMRKGMEEMVWILLEYGWHRTSYELLSVDESQWFDDDATSLQIWEQSKGVGMSTPYLSRMHPGVRNEYIRKRIELVSKGLLPTDTFHKAAPLGAYVASKAEVELVSLFEKNMLGSLLRFYSIDASVDDWVEQTLCKSCQAGIEHEDRTIRQVWRERDARLKYWRRHDKAFTYGFIPRCRICRSALLQLPHLPSAATCRPILPSRTIGFEDMAVLNEEEDLSHLCRMRTALEDAKASHLLLLPRYWLTRCLKSHLTCHVEIQRLKTQEAIAAKRLICLKTELPFIQEITYEYEDLQYCTLSYRWESDAVTLCKANKAQFYQALPIHDLPATIQSAIWIARQLGMQFMWIDALCIVQDDEEDWKDQAAKMGAIYSGSLLTVAAIDGADARRPGSLLGYDESSASRHRFGTKIDPKLPHADWFRPPGVLDQRGWYLQEQTLSRRVLSFSKAGIFWDCSQWHCSEAKPSGINTPTESSWRGSPFSESTYVATPWYRTPDLHAWSASKYKNSTAGRELWHRLVENYTRRSLTFATDRLVAIRGVANRFEKLCDVSISLGMWMPHLLQELLWRPAERPGQDALTGSDLSHVRSDRTEQKIQKHLKQTKQRISAIFDRKAKSTSINKDWQAPSIPSWSWGSYPGPIDYASATQSVSPFVQVEYFDIDEDRESSMSNTIAVWGTMIPVLITNQRHVFFVTYDKETWRPVDQDRFDCNAQPTSTYSRLSGLQDAQARAATLMDHQEPLNPKTDTIFDSDYKWSGDALCEILFMGKHSLVLQRQISGNWRRVGLCRWDDMTTGSLSQNLATVDNKQIPDHYHQPRMIEYQRSGVYDSTPQGSHADIVVWVRRMRVILE